MIRRTPRHCQSTGYQEAILIHVGLMVMIMMVLTIQVLWG
jgi:hypothetical protein